MKSYKNLFNKIVSFDNLLLASRKARKGKRFKHACALFEMNLEQELLELQERLATETYQHGEYRDFIVYDSKKRLISAAPYRDRVVHHALCNVIEPLFDRSFIHDTYACRKGKGAHAAMDRFTRYARRYPYVLKCDIRKYFQSIDHEILLALIEKRIRGRKTRWLIREIVSSRSDSTYPAYFHGDTLLTPLTRSRGIPIGNLTSQFFANLYLDGFDHFVKEELRLPYIRYVDDFVAFSHDKRHLLKVKEKMTEYLAALRLSMHPNKSRVFRVADGVRFLGFRIFPDHRLLARENILRARRRLKKLGQEYGDGKIPFTRVHQSVQSWIGHAGHGDTFRLRERLLAGVVFQRGAAKGAAGRFVEQQP